MYTSRETMVAKANQLNIMGLYPERLIIAREMTERWPEHPSGWSHLAEIYGYYYGMGNEAAKTVQLGLQCKGLHDSIYWEPLTVQSMYFAETPAQLKTAIDEILEYFPNNQDAPLAMEIKSKSEGRYTANELAALHSTQGFVSSKENVTPGFSASKWDLACSQLLKIGEINEFRSAFVCLIDELRFADDLMNNHRQSLGLGFAPEDRLSLKYRAELFELFIPKYFPKDPQMHNKWAATYNILEAYDAFQRIISLALELKRYDKPLINKADILSTQGTNYHYAGDFNSALNKHKEAMAFLEEAVRLGGEPASQQVALKKLEEIKYVLNDIADVLIEYPRKKLRDHSEGIKKYRLMQMKEMPMIAFRSDFTSKDAAQWVNKRLNMEDYPDVLQCTVELMEDMNPPFAFSIISEFRSQGRTFELFTRTLSDIASNKEKYGAMHRDAQETLAILLLEANDPEDIHQTFLYLNTLFPHLSETILSSISITFNSQLESSLRGIIKIEQPSSLPNNFIWWRTRKTTNSTQDNSLFQRIKSRFFGRIKSNLLGD